MKKAIEQILPNPHRNFDIYPIGETQVALLMESIKEVGMFLGLPARKTQAGYEIACGHHRLEALKRTGATHVDIAVNDYSDDEMLKIMIRENSTQRGNENFGAVLDSVGAVLVACVRDVYGDLNNCSDPILNGNIENGRGIGRDNILKKEPSFSLRQVQHALETFRSTGIYLTLLKKGGLPEQFWHLYEKEPPTTTIEAVAMFPKPAHAAAWVKGVEDARFQQKTNIESHISMVNEMISTAANANKPLSVNYIKEYIDGKINTNLGEVDPDESKKNENKSLDEKAEAIVKAIKGLKNKLDRFRMEKEATNQDCYMEDMNAIIDLLVDSLEWLKIIRNEEIITINN